MRTPLPARTLLAIAEEGGYRLHEARGLTRRYVREVLQHERDEKTGGLVLPAPKGGPRRTPEDRLRELYRGRKLPEHVVERKVREATGRAAGAKPRRK